MCSISSEVARLGDAHTALQTWMKQAEELRYYLQQDDAALSRLQEAVTGAQDGGPTDGETLTVTAKGLTRMLASAQVRTFLQPH